MKYLFYIHSAITELVSFHTICELGIPEHDVIFLKNRNYSPNIKTFKTVNFLYHAYDSYFRGSKNLPRSWYRFYRFNKYISKIVSGDDYYAYVPLTYPDYMSLLIYHPRCKGYSIIEEGAYAYLNQEEANKVYKEKKAFIWDRLGYFGTLRDGKFYNDDYDFVIGFSNDSFPGFERRKILKGDRKVDFINYKLENNASVVVLSAESMHGEIPLTNYTDALTAFISDHLKNKQNANFYYKLHPAQVGTKEEEVYNDFFNQESFPSFDKLPSNISLEFLAQQKSDITFYVSDSSVAIYARLFGRPVYSFVDYLIESYPPHKEDVKKMPSILLKSIVRLKPNYSSDTDGLKIKGER